MNGELYDKAEQLIAVARPNGNQDDTYRLRMCPFCYNVSRRLSIGECGWCGGQFKPRQAHPVDYWPCDAGHLGNVLRGLNRAAIYALRLLGPHGLEVKDWPARMYVDRAKRAAGCDNGDFLPVAELMQKMPGPRRLK